MFSWKTWVIKYITKNKHWGDGSNDTSPEEECRLNLEFCDFRIVHIDSDKQSSDEKLNTNDGEDFGDKAASGSGGQWGFLILCFVHDTIDCKYLL